eukprot:TRINITY_DN50591_c0_g1_i1.p2 TRINITY_DN50591_c0_g1~~TRINITY_DN50591_c0_g1_i1.p2  ORF type:complete len:162 (-),score=31.45 TRINITY_DN50591_c0_g1_i1:263-748(-)
MAKQKLPVLENLVEPVEMLHITAFPSVQRTILNDTLLPYLENSGNIGQLKQVTMHRVIDNQPFTMDATQFWTHMNYQLVHLLDFLPIANWEDNLDDPQLHIFFEVYNFLKRNGQLHAKVDADVLESAGGLVYKIKKRLFINSVNQYSAEVGHNLEFTCDFN